MLSVLENAFFEVRKYLMETGLGRLGTLQQNPKGDVTKQFDFEAEGIAINYLAKNVPEPIKIVTEERGEIASKSGTPKYTAVIDPVDGSKNFGRKIENTAFSVAVLPADKEFTLQNVEYALVGLVWSGAVFKAQEGKGAYRNNMVIHTSKCEKLEEALINVDTLDRAEKFERILPVIKTAKEIRKLGTSASEQAYVAAGSFDAHLDVRDKLTAENFFAGQLLIKEGGGVFTDDKGEEITEKIDMLKPYNIVASGNKKLHEQILEALGE